MNKIEIWDRAEQRLLYQASVFNPPGWELGANIQLGDIVGRVKKYSIRYSAYGETIYSIEIEAATDLEFWNDLEEKVQCV